MLTSMSRADVLVTAQPGETLTISLEHYCEGKDAFSAGTRTWCEIIGVANSQAQAGDDRILSRP